MMDLAQIEALTAETITYKGKKVSELKEDELKEAVVNLSKQSFRDQIYHKREFDMFKILRRVR
jgi:ABC-type iron transport system FetAB ATPase subunit